MLEKRQATVLVTVVEEQGSAPRGTGACMLVGARGRLVGTIGGGAVEKRAEETALHLLGEQRSLLFSFELRPGTAENNVGMVCGGDVTVWFQYIPGESALWKDLAAAAVSRLQSGEPAWLALRLDGGEPALLDAAGCSIAGAEPAESGLVAPGCLRKGTYFSLPLPPGERVFVFGGGHIALALVPLLKSVGFRPVVFDCRPEYAATERFPAAEQVICGDFLHLSDYVNLKEEDYAVVMTNGHAFDFEVQDQILRRPLAYVGVIGSRSKTAAVNARLRERGVPEDAIAAVHTPVGVSIKAVTPEEIAVSIAAEMILVRALRREGEAEPHHACPMH